MRTAKLKEGIFVQPENRQTLEACTFVESLTDTELEARGKSEVSLSQVLRQKEIS
jgi:hypothetical protein